MGTSELAVDERKNDAILALLDFPDHIENVQEVVYHRVRALKGLLERGHYALSGLLYKVEEELCKGKADSLAAFLESPEIEVPYGTAMKLICGLFEGHKHLWRLRSDKPIYPAMFPFFAIKDHLLMCSEHIPVRDIIENNSWDVKIVSEMHDGLEFLGIDNDRLFKRFANGDTCFLVQDNGKYVGALWGHIGDCYIKGIKERLGLEQNEVYMYGVFVHPEARRKNIFNSLKNTFFKFYSDRNIQKYYALVVNPIVKTALQKDNFEKQARLLSIKIGGVNLLYEFNYRSGKQRLTMGTKTPANCAII